MTDENKLQQELINLLVKLKEYVPLNEKQVLVHNINQISRGYISNKMELDPQKNPINQVAFVVWLVVKEHPSLLDKQPIMIIKEFQNHLLEEFQKYSEFISGRSEASPHHLKGK